MLRLSLIPSACLGAALLPLVLLSACGPPGVSEGRRGNDAYADSSFDEAARSYRAGLSGLHGAEQDPMRAKLFNNLGAARFQQKSFQKARSAFQRSIAAAREEEPLARALYNAGNAAFRMDSAQVALRRYRAALLSDPDYRAAKFNYEFVKRNLPESKQKNKNKKKQNPPDVEPSAYARKLKRKADDLAERRAYRKAHRLMEQGLRVDRTVRAYQSFIKRLKDVANIDAPSDSPGPPPDEKPSASSSNRT